MSDAEQGAAAAAASAEAPKPKLSAAEKQARMLKQARFVTYVTSVNNKQEEVFGRHKFMGLHSSLGEKEIARLQGAMQRHNREDGFDSMELPVDVLLRTLTFVPTKFHPALGNRDEPTVADPRALRHKTLERLCCVNSTLLHTVSENKNLLGGKKPNEKDIAKATAARMAWNRGARPQPPKTLSQFRKRSPPSPRSASLKISRKRLDSDDSDCDYQCEMMG